MSNIVILNKPSWVIPELHSDTQDRKFLCCVTHKNCKLDVYLDLIKPETASYHDNKDRKFGITLVKRCGEVRNMYICVLLEKAWMGDFDSEIKDELYMIAEEIDRFTFQRST